MGLPMIPVEEENDESKERKRGSEEQRDTYTNFTDNFKRRVWIEQKK